MIGSLLLKITIAVIILTSNTIDACNIDFNNLNESDFITNQNSTLIQSIVIDEKDILTCLPLEIQYNISDYLSLKDIKQFACVNQACYATQNEILSHYLKFAHKLNSAVIGFESCDHLKIIRAARNGQFDLMPVNEYINCQDSIMVTNDGQVSTIAGYKTIDNSNSFIYRGCRSADESLYGGFARMTPGGYTAMVCSSDCAEIIFILPNDDEYNSQIEGINFNGSVVFGYRIPRYLKQNIINSSRALLCKSGEDAKLLPNSKNDGYTTVCAINDTGDITAGASFNSKQYRTDACVWIDNHHYVISDLLNYHCSLEQKKLLKNLRLMKVYQVSSNGYSMLIQAINMSKRYYPYEYYLLVFKK